MSFFPGIVIAFRQVGLVLGDLRTSVRTYYLAIPNKPTIYPTRIKVVYFIVKRFGLSVGIIRLTNCFEERSKPIEFEITILNLLKTGGSF